MSVLRISIAVGLAVLVGGCVAEPKRADVEGRILLEDTYVADRLRIVRQDSDRIQGNLMRLRTEIKNKTEEDLWVDVLVIWKDGKGYEIYKTNWAPLLLPARYVTTHEIASLRSEVADYEFRIRRPTKTIGRP